MLMSIFNTGSTEVLWAFACGSLLWYMECTEEKKKVKGVVPRRRRHTVQCNHIYYFVVVEIRPPIVMYLPSTNLCILSRLIYTLKIKHLYFCNKSKFS